MNTKTYGQLVNSEIEFKSEPVATVTIAPKAVDSWEGLPLIMDAIDLYADMKLLGVLGTGKTFLISYKGIQYTIGDNGGEINVAKVNDPSFFRPFPTVYFSMSLNSETLMYRLLCVLKDEEIDYKHREEAFHHLAVS